ncbi:hypothetical protein AB1Y20_007436 [Prymnesium parvum]|uniref:Uncharacterized protein n=1 Tax=Prymnesium parvum TaxID=97485 RepID=A0AB34IXY7_PRYPA
MACEPSYSCIYSNPRKRKEASQDGTLLLAPSSGKVFLVSEEGERIASKPMKPEEMGKLASGGQLLLGGWAVELVELASTADAAAAACPPAAKPAAPPPRAPGPLRAAFAPRMRLATPSAAAAEEELVLNRGEEGETPVCVERRLAAALHPHQREGVQFMYDCLMGRRRSEDDEPFAGCILAHSMGLGKTIQALTLVHTMLRCGPQKVPVLKKALIVCPASLCNNWMSEWKKWFPTGSTSFRPRVLPPTKAQAILTVRDFIHCPPEKLLILSYEALRSHADALAAAPIGLVVCDEGHRLKSSAGNQTTDALRKQRSARRVLLSGTPVQNDLDELWAMCEFASPGSLGALAAFRARFALPIGAARDAAEGEEGEEGEEARRHGEAVAAELRARTARLVLRRDEAMLRRLLPPRTELLVCAALSAAQRAAYAEAVLARGAEGSASGLQAVLALRGVCSAGAASAAEDEEGCVLKEKGAEAAADVGKLEALMRLLPAVRAAGEKVVIAAQYRRSLDLLQAAFASRGWGALRLDGNVGAERRQQLVDRFNAPHATEFAFLLSTRAGGTGFNLCAASRLVMYDPDWNPAADLQAMARVYRQGQTRPVYIWRLLSAGTIEEKMYQRQLFKTQLAEEVMTRDCSVKEGRFSREELAELFTYDERCCCGTLALLQQAKGAHDPLALQREEGWRNEWVASLPDETLRAALEGDEELRSLVTYAADVRVLEELCDRQPGRETE